MIGRSPRTTIANRAADLPFCTVLAPTPATPRATVSLLTERWFPGEDSNLECQDQNLMCCLLHHRGRNTRVVARAPERG